MSKLTPDIRWQQRFANYRKALRQLDEFLEKPSLNKLEEQGLIKAFEYTYELGWNTLRDFLHYQGEQNLIGSRDTIRRSFATGLISDGHGWMDMLESRNHTSHTYNEATAHDIANAVRNRYAPLFEKLEQTLLSRL